MIADIALLEKASRKSEKSSKLNTEAFITLKILEQVKRTSSSETLKN